jgi:hypothetical protein
MVACLRDERERPHDLLFGFENGTSDLIDFRKRAADWPCNRRDDYRKDPTKLGESVTLSEQNYKK